MPVQQLSIRLTLFLIPVIFIILWIYELKQGKMPYIDQVTREFVSMIANTPVYTFFRWITELGSRTFVLPFTLIMMVILGWLTKSGIVPLIFGSGTLGAQLINRMIKQLIERERPSISAALNAQGYSFPSGHAMTSIVCYGLVAYFLSQSFPERKKIIVISFGILILLIGASRYFINVHYITDILTGFFFGYVWLLFVLFLYRKLKKPLISAFDPDEK